MCNSCYRDRAEHTHIILCTQNRSFPHWSARAFKSLIPPLHTRDPDTPFHTRPLAMDFWAFSRYLLAGLLACGKKATASLRCQRRPETKQVLETPNEKLNEKFNETSETTAPMTPPNLDNESWWPPWAHHGPNPSQRCSWDAHGNALTPRSGRRVKRTHSTDL